MTKLLIGITVGIYINLLACYVGQAWAQQQPSAIEQAVKANLGELLFTNTVLVTQLKAAQEENVKLKAELEELRKEKENAK